MIKQAASFQKKEPPACDIQYVAADISMKERPLALSLLL